MKTRSVAVSTALCRATGHVEASAICSANALSVQRQIKVMESKPFSSYVASQTAHRTHEEAVSEVQREMEVRRRLYDKWVSEGKVSRVDAHDRLERIMAALQFLIGERTPVQGAF